MTRALKPRATEALAVSPMFVSDLSAPAVMGIEGRVFRELVRDLRVPHVRRGQRLLVDVLLLREVLARVARAGSPHIEPAEEESDEPTSSELLARVGRVRTGGARR